MLWHRIRIPAVCCLVVTVCLGTGYSGTNGEAGGADVVRVSFASEEAAPPAAEPAPAEQPEPSAMERLLEACGSAKGAFVPRTEDHLKEAEKNLRAAVAQLDANLKAAGPAGEGWKTFLNWSGLQEELKRDGGPDPAALDAIYAQYASGHNGLELVQFLEVRRALKQYLTTARAIGNPKVRKQYEALLDGLPKHFKAYDEKPTTDGAHVIGASVQWLEEAGQAAELVEAIRGQYSSPNGFVEMGADLTAAGMATEVDDSGPASDVILGTRLTGTEHTTGRITSELIPRQDFAEISALLYATVKTKSVGVNGPARAVSEATTQIASRKAIRIDAQRVWTLPAQSNAITKSKMTNLSVSGGRMVQSRARQQAASQKPQAERIAAQHAEQRANQRLNEETDLMIADMVDDYQNKFRKPLLMRNMFPQVFRVFTTAEAMQAVALHGGFSGLGVSEEPPKLEGQYDLTIRAHESLVNNYTSAAWSGMIMVEETVRAQIVELLESTPSWLEPDEESEPWTISMARRQPLSFTFTDNGFSVTLRGRQFIRGGTTYPGMNVTAEYEIQKSDEVVKAVRKGGLAIYPPGFKPGGGKSLSTRQQILRSLLEKRFEKIFTPEMVPEPFTLPGALENAGELGLAAWESSDGWMLQGWNRIPESEKAADDTPADKAATPEAEKPAANAPTE
ncbi:MAG: hypothetical protein HQ582_00090 [Planctomycetes bacterium]|nr:hypothetical protein [Planctomycetota bacterium]